MSKKILTIWFNDKGDLLNQASSYAIRARGATYKSEEAKDFKDRMEFVNICQFRNSSRVELRSVISGRKYNMFASDFNEVIHAHKFIDNHVEGIFRFLKKGSGQAIKLITPAP